MKKKLLVALAFVLCLAVCTCCLAACHSEAEAAAISLNQTSLSIALDGEPVTLVASLSEGEGTFTWESSAPEVISVDQNGTVTPVSRGTAIITVKCDKLKPASCKVVVGEPLHMPVFQADSMGLGTVVALDQGETYQIIDTVTYNGTVVDVDVRYSSLDETVATVSETGVVTAVAMGSGDITVSAEYLGIKIEMVVTVAVQSEVSFTAATSQMVSLTKRVTGKCITLIDADKQITSKPLSVKLDSVSEKADIQWSIADGGEAYVSLSATTGESITVSAAGVGETTVLASAVIDGTKYTVAFGVTVEEGAYTVIHTDNGKAASKTACDGFCDVCGQKIVITHADRDRDCTCDWCGATIHTDGNFDGICDSNPEHDLRIHLNQHNAGTPAQFAAVVADNADKYIVLDGDLNWSGNGTDNLFGNTYSEYTTVMAIANFRGVLDGQGHIISDFRLGHSGSDNTSAMFLKNSGVIRNMGFIYTLTTANSAHTGLVYDNVGVVENVFVDVTVNARSWSTGTIAGINTGTVRNCIAVVNEASTGKDGHLAGIVGAFRGGRIANCYAVGNGHTTTADAYTERFSGMFVSDYAQFTNNNGLLAAVRAFSGDWAGCWTVAEEGIKFGEKLVIAYICEHIDNGKTENATACDGVCDFCGETVEITHGDGNNDCICDWCSASIHTDEDINGICDNNAQHDLRILLNEANAGTPALFAAVVAENADRYLLLTENLDWSGAGKDDLFGNTYSEYTAVKLIESFSGVLDGDGHFVYGFRLGHSGVANDSAMFLENSGTIKNIGFIYTLATANSGQTGLVRDNTGTIENVFIDITVNARSWATGAVAGINEGTVRNCIAVVNEASAGTGNNLAGMVGAYRDGSIVNCYAIGNGHTTTENAYTECFNGLAVPVYTHFAGNNDLLAAVTAFSSADGWANSWAVSNEGITFGSRLVIAYICSHADDGKTAGAIACDGICDLCGEAVKIIHTDGNGDCLCDNCGATLHTDANIDGICDNNSTHILAVQLNKENAGTPALFAATVTENADKFLILTEDLDWSGQSTANCVVASFDGVLDGHGHSIKGFTLGVGAVGEQYYTCLIVTNNGTIKNLAFEYKLVKAEGNSSSLVAMNYGTVENVFVAASFESYSWTTGAIVAINQGTGTVKNCITTVSSTLNDQPAKDRLGSIASVDYNGKLMKCYAVNTESSKMTPYADTWGNGDYTGSAVYASSKALLDAVTALPSGDGWSGYWAVSSEGITFNNAVVIAVSSGSGGTCTHVDTSPADGKCDLCGESVEASGDIYYINSKTAPTVAAFVSLINADLDGTYYLTEDLSYSSAVANNVGIKDFAGILDGQGHTVKGIKIQYNSNNAYATNLFKSNSGTIRNIAFEYSIVAANGSQNALISTNTGTIENVYAKATVTKVRTQGYNSPFVANNDGASAVVKNCIVDVTLAGSITSLDASHGAVVSLNNNGAKVANCYYKVTGVSMPGIAYPWGGTNSTEVLSATVTTLPASDGWASYWSISSGTVKFGE